MGFKQMFVGGRGGSSLGEISNHSRNYDEEYQLPESDIPKDDLEFSFWKQIKRLGVDTVFGRSIANPNVEGSMSYAGGRDSSAALRRSAGRSPRAKSFASRRSETGIMKDQRRDAFKGKYIVDPDNGYLLMWEQVILLLGAYSAFITPFEFAFLPIPPPGLYWTDVAVNFFFLADFFLTFFVAYKDKKTYTFVTDHESIAIRYAKSTLIPDFLSLLPWTTFYKVAGAQGAAEVFRWLLWTRCFRARHVLHFFKRLQRDIRLSYFAVRICMLVVIELYITHVAACFFYYLATTYPPEEEGYTWMGSLTLGAFSYANFRDIDIFTRYITAMYWSVVTMATIGYGDIHPVNTREMIFAMVYILFDLIFSAYLVGNITALVVKGSATTKYREKLSALVKFMNRNHLPHVLREQMRRHVRLQFETEQVEDEILDEFPVTIRHKVSRALYRRVVEQCYLFKGCQPEFINQIVARSVPEYYFPSEVIIQHRDAADHMYIICSGVVQESPTANPTADDADDIVNLGPGSAFGEVALLCNIPQPFAVTVTELCQVLRIDKQMLNSVISLFIVDGRQIVENLLERTKESESKFASLSSEISSLIAQQEAELTMTTIYAASRGEIEHLRQLIRAGANVSKADYDGRSPLHLAAASGFDEVLKFLILEGADVNCRDNFGTTPLLEALRAGHDSTAKLLREKGATVDLQEAGTDLCNAVIHGDTGLLTRLLAYGVDPNSADYDLRAPLHIAAAEGYLQVAKVLVENGADVAARDRWGNTPLDEARRCGSLPLVHMLEEAMIKKGLKIAESPSHSFASLPGLPPPATATATATASAALPVPVVAPSLAAAASGAQETTVTEASPLLPPLSASPCPLRPSTSHSSAAPSPGQWDVLDSMSTGSSPARGYGSPGRMGGYRPPGMPGRRSAGPRGGGGGGGGGSGASRGQPSRKRVTVYAFPPWEPSQRVGRLMWLPPTVKELLDSVRTATERPDLTHVLTSDGAEVTDMDLVVDSDKLYVMTDAELAQQR